MAITNVTFDTMRALAETISANEKLEISRAIFTNVMTPNEIENRHIVITDVVDGDVQPLLDDSVNYKSMPFLSKTECAINDCSLDLGFAGKKWIMAPIGCRFRICFKTFTPDFRRFFNQNFQVLHNLNDQDQLSLYIQSKVQKNLEGAKYRIGYFGDTTEGAGANQNLLNGIDGFFTQAEAGGGTKFLFNQVNPTGEEFYAAATQMYNAMMLDTDWAGSPNKVIKMTRRMAALWVQWMNSLQDRSGYNCECFSVDGITSLRTFTLEGNLVLFGIKVQVEQDLDNIISQLTLGNPYRMLLTEETNLLIGTQNSEDLNAFDVWYSKETKELVIEAEAYLGAMIPTDNYVYVGAEVASV